MDVNLSATFDQSDLRLQLHCNINHDKRMDNCYNVCISNYNLDLDVCHSTPSICYTMIHLSLSDDIQASIFKSQMF